MKRVFLCVDIILAAAVAAIAVFLIAGRPAEQSDAEDDSGDPADANEAVTDDSGGDMPDITYEGRTYAYNQNIRTYLLMGIDREDIIDTGDTLLNQAGQADVNLLFIVDEENKTYRVLAISRDSMVDVDYYNASGEYVNTDKRQICLQYAYGGGGENSAALQCNAVSKLLYGIPVTRYAAIPMDAIPTVNDLIGGVTVEALYDVPDLCSKGEEITLKGRDALRYIRYRDTSRYSTNAERMARQQQYFKAFTQKLDKVMEQDIAAPMTVWSAVQKKAVTNVTAEEFRSLCHMTGEAEDGGDDYLTVPGEIRHNEETEHDEFYVDDQSLYGMIVELFYREKDAP